MRVSVCKQLPEISAQGKNGVPVTSPLSLGDPLKIYPIAEHPDNRNSWRQCSVE